jgi:uncharacterized protein (TIGR02231 family)
MTVRTGCLATTALAGVILLTAAPSWAADLEAVSTVDAVTVYPDGASVTRLITLDLPEGETALTAKDFPLGLDVSSLRVEGEAAAKLVIGAVDAKPPRAAPPVNLPEIDKQIETLKDTRADLDDAIAAATARRKFAERFAESAPAGLGNKGEARPLSEWRAAFTAISEEVATADNAIREAVRKQRDIDRDIARLEADRASKPPAKLALKIDLATAAATRATLRVTYAVRHAHWEPLYDARLDTSAPDHKVALELVRRAEIVQSTGEDWSNVALSVSTMRTARGGSAPELKTLIAQYPPPPMQMPAPAATLEKPRALARSAASDIADKRMKQAEEQEATVEASAFQTAFRIPGRVSVNAADGAKSLRISTATIAPDLVVRAAPVLDPAAYLEASFVQNEDAPLLPGKVSIYRDGAFVGVSHMAAAAKDETVRLGFGADDRVKVERTVLRRNEGTAGLIVTTAKTDERAFKTTIRNGHDFPIKLAIQDQLPVSENEDIQVELLPASTPPTTTNVRDRRGVLEWAFEVKRGEARDIAFAYRLRWPKDKAIVVTPSG